MYPPLAEPLGLVGGFETGLFLTGMGRAMVLLDASMPQTRNAWIMGLTSKGHVFERDELVQDLHFHD